jgi:hypothetical protein
MIATALVAVLLARENAAALAYVSGSLGTLIGADLLNLDAVRGLGAPVASILSTAFFSPASWRCCSRASRAKHETVLPLLLAPVTPGSSACLRA